MGIGEFLKESLIPGYSLTKDIQKHGVCGGIKENFRKNILEGTPVISTLYKAGKKRGKNEGYVEASEEYEKKLLSQADEFLKQKELFSQQREEYEQLLSEYEEEKERLEQKQARTEEENQLLQALLSRERQLKKLA